LAEDAVWFASFEEAPRDVAGADLRKTPMSPNELLVLALAISVAATSYFAVLALARRLGVAIALRWSAEGWPLLVLVGVACVAGAMLPLGLLVPAVAIGAANGAAIVLMTWLALRKLK
jgi:hypothetical protein